MQVTRTSFASSSTGSPGAERESHRVSPRSARPTVNKADRVCKTTVLAESQLHGRTKRTDKADGQRSHLFFD